jgi:hypothetical protein
MSIEIGHVLPTHESFSLDIANVITGRTFIASITRFGKSWTCRKIIEKCFGHAGIIIIDVEGEYSSLREKFPFLIIGKDIPLQLETAEFMAEKILESKISVIIDLSMTEVELGKEYVNHFLRRFFFLETTLRQPYLIAVEEAEEFGPERGIATTTCLEILRNITKKGGKRGIGILVITHRPAWISKGIISQCTSKALGRIDWPSDLDVLENFARIPHQTIEKLPTLAKGEFCFAGDWVKAITFVKVGQVKTTHLGFTPEIIPPSPKELQGVIESLKKALPEVIEKIKPTVTPIEDIKKKVKEEVEAKYKERIETIQRTAEEKAERKFKAKIDQLQEHIEKLSRSQALQPTSPISDVLEHPIIKTRMLELPAKDRDMLIKIEREPGLTREQLAAFLTTSTNNIASMVDRINRVFRATAIIGEGKPMKYKSLLKRLFITDVAKREIEELERLQRTINQQSETLALLQPQIDELRRKRMEVNEKNHELETLNSDIRKKDAKITELTSLYENVKQEREELMATAKVAAPLKTAINLIIDERMANLKPLTNMPANVPSIDESAIMKKVEDKIKEEMAMLTPTPNSGSIPTSVSLEHKVTHFDFQKPEEHFKADTTNLQGRIIFLITRGFFDQRHNRKEVVTELSNNGWVHDDREVDATLLELCGKGIFYRKISSGNVFWYTLQPEAKAQIH